MGKRPQTCFTYLHTAWYHYHPDNLNQNELIPPSLEKFAGTNAGVKNLCPILLGNILAAPLYQNYSRRSHYSCAVNSRTQSQGLTDLKFQWIRSESSVFRT